MVVMARRAVCRSFILLICAIGFIQLKNFALISKLPVGKETL